MTPINLTSVPNLSEYSSESIRNSPILTVGKKTYKVTFNESVSVSRDLGDVKYRTLNAMYDFFSRMFTSGEHAMKTRSNQLKEIIQTKISVTTLDSQLTKVRNPENENNKLIAELAQIRSENESLKAELVQNRSDSKSQLKENKTLTAELEKSFSENTSNKVLITELEKSSSDNKTKIDELVENLSKSKDRVIAQENTIFTLNRQLQAINEAADTKESKKIGNKVKQLLGTWSSPTKGLKEFNAIDSKEENAVNELEKNICEKLWKKRDADTNIIKYCEASFRKIDDKPEAIKQHLLGYAAYLKDEFMHANPSKNQHDPKVNEFEPYIANLLDLKGNRDKAGKSLLENDVRAKVDRNKYDSVDEVLPAIRRGVRMELTAKVAKTVMLKLNIIIDKYINESLGKKDSTLVTSTRVNELANEYLKTSDQYRMSS